MTNKEKKEWFEGENMDEKDLTIQRLRMDIERLKKEIDTQKKQIEDYEAAIQEALKEVRQ